MRAGYTKKKPPKSKSLYFIAKCMTTKKLFISVYTPTTTKPAE